MVNECTHIVKDSIVQLAEPSLRNFLLWNQIENLIYSFDYLWTFDLSFL